MIGYHYTSYENWKKIKKEGLIPYHIPNDKLGGYFPKGHDGVWIWIKPQRGFAHTGSIIFQAATKQSEKIVVLRVNYSEADCLRHGKQILLLYHSGTLNEMPYHDGTQKARIVTRNIPSSDIELLKVYDLTNTFEEYDGRF